MKLTVVPVTPFMQNCSILWNPQTRAGAVVDPGGDVDRIIEAAQSRGIKLEKILLTHGHIDHAGGTAELSERLGLPIEGPHIADKFLIEQIPEHGRMFGFAGARSFTPVRWLEDGDTVSFDDYTLEVRHCPGHTPGHVVFYHAPSRLATVGDVLFQGSIGRTDLPQGDYSTLIHSIRDKLWPLGEEVNFVPGHGPMSTFGHERKMNPFVSDFALEINPV